MKYYAEWYLPDSIQSEGYEWFSSFVTAFDWIRQHMAADKTRIGRFFVAASVTPQEAAGAAAALSHYRLGI